jgi:hypothetical protein
MAKPQRFKNSLWDKDNNAINVAYLKNPVKCQPVAGVIREKTRKERERSRLCLTTDSCLPPNLHTASEQGKRERGRS